MSFSPVKTLSEFSPPITLRPRSVIKKGATLILRPLSPIENVKLASGGCHELRYPFMPGGGSVTGTSPSTVTPLISNKSSTRQFVTLSTLTISSSPREDVMQELTGSSKPLGQLGLSDFVTEKGNRYTLGKRLGQGTFGDVVEVKSVKTGKLYALKTVRDDAKGSNDGKSVTESEVIRLLGKHENIVNCRSMGEFSRDTEGQVHKDGTYFLMEKADCDLTTLLNSEVHVSEAMLTHIMSNMMKALIHLAEHQIVHADTKPGNILMFSGVDKKGQPFTKFKLADFGSARLMGDEMTSIPGSLLYAAPEVLSDEASTPASDVFSHALTFYQLATKTHFVPDNYNGQIAIRTFYSDDTYPGRLKSATEALKSALGSDSNLVSLIIGMLALNPAERLTPTQVLKSLA